MSPNRCSPLNFVILLILILSSFSNADPWEPVGVLPYGPFNIILEAEGRIWVAGGGTVFEFDPDAGNAVAVDTIFVNGARRGMAVNDGKLYLSTDANGVFTFDISERPITQISRWTPPNAERLEDCVVLPDGNLAVSSKTTNIFFLNSTGDQLLGTYTDGGEGWFGNIEIMDDLLLAVRAPYPLRMMLLDVSNVAEPESLNVHAFRDWVNDFLPVNDTLCYVSAGTDGIYLMNLANPMVPEQIGHANSMYGNSKAGPMSFDGETLLVSHIGGRGSPEGGLGIYSADLDSIRWFRWTGGDVQAPLMRENEAWVLKAREGIYSVNLQNLQNPSINYLHRLPHQVEGVYVRDNLAYLAEGHGGLRIIDYSDPTIPHEIGWCDNIGLMEDIWVDDNSAYVADGNGLLIFDVSNPTEPEQIAHVSIDALQTRWVEGVAVENDVMYIASHFGLIIADVSDPSTPTGVGSVETSLLKDLAVRDGIAYIADDDFLRIIDCNIPREPVELSRLQMLGGGAWDVALRDTLALVSDREYGLLVVSVADPENPELVGSLELESCQGLDDDGFFTYVGMVWDGLVAVDINDPTNPEIVAFYNTPGGVLNVKSDGNIVVAADYNNGTSYFPVPEIQSIRNNSQVIFPNQLSLSNYPNPFNSSTSINFALFKPGFLTITIFEPSGREISEIGAGWYTTGRHSINWNAGTIPSGIYYLSIKSGIALATQRITLIR